MATSPAWSVRPSPPSSARPVGVLPWVALGVVYVLWGSTYLANKLIIATVPPLLLGGVRFLIGGIAARAWSCWSVAGRRAFRMTRAQLGTTALSGVLLPAWGNGLVALGQQQVASGLAALLIASVPLYIVLLRALTGDRPRLATFLGVGVGVVGLAVLLLAGPSGGSGGVFGNAWWGPWLVLLAALGWATGTFCTTRLPVPPNPFALAAVQMLVGGRCCCAISLGIGDRLDVAAVPPVAWWAWAYLSVVVTLGAFSAYAYALATPAGVHRRHLRLREPGDRGAARRAGGGGAVLRGAAARRGDRAGRGGAGDHRRASRAPVSAGTSPPSSG